MTWINEDPATDAAKAILGAGRLLSKRHPSNQRKQAECQPNSVSEEDQELHLNAPILSPRRKGLEPMAVMRCKCGAHPVVDSDEVRCPQGTRHESARSETTEALIQAIIVWNATKAERFPERV